ncbi:hypothetical protein A2467_00655 [Candidatus Nomurabacteria bacterium RIFOXYC2_FULL_36_8]|nr:MAG: hypothetical protein A2467_00655 [Candidatus Nomurabacteria bacterium RIFOXYC2_FULL_36_8]
MKKKLLLNWVYYPPVGHAVEALKLAKGYSLANKNLDVYLLLNANTPTELADACSWIKKTYSISTEEVFKDGEKAKCLQKFPKNWDYISSDNRAGRLIKGNDRVELVKTQEVLQKIFVARNSSILPVVHNPKITLSIPTKAKTFAKKFKHRGPTIAIMLGGAKGLRQSPSIEMWLKICLALEQAIPNLKIYFMGITKSDHHRTFTKDFTLDDVNYLIKHLKNAESAYNIGLWNQIALIKKCDIFLSPHTGFAFLAFLVDAPWLEIATCRWPLYFLNDVPFYSVLPKCNSYPSLDDRTKECDRLLREGKRVACVADDLIEKKIPEIVKGAKLLLDKSFTYNKAIKLHLRKIRKDYDVHRFPSFGAKKDENK